MRSQLSMAVAVALLVLPVLGVSATDSVNSVTTTTTVRIKSFCTYVGLGSLTVHVVDEKGKPIQNAVVMINGTATCIVQEAEERVGILDSSGVTDSDGYAFFPLYPTKYNVSVILPDSLQGRTIFMTQITGRVGTFWTTVHVACTPSADQCMIAAPQSETQTTSVTAAPIPFLDFPAILFAILLGLFLVARRSEQTRRDAGKR